MRIRVPRCLLWTLVMMLSLWSGLGSALGQVAAEVLDVEADSFLRSGAANTNEGANYNLVLRASGKNRALVRFDTSQLSGPVTLARLKLYIVYNADNWGSEGRAIGAYRVTEEWTEGNGANQQPKNLTQAEFNAFKTRGNGPGVTWKCATDGDINNHNPDCDPKWNGGTFAAEPIDTVTIHKFMTGVEIAFDVTMDVQACIDEEALSCSWMVKKVQDGQSGRVEFASKEGTASTNGDYDQASPPQLEVDEPLYDRYAVDATNARVRFSNLVEDADGIDIVLGAGPTALIEDFPFPGTTPYTPFPPGTYDFHFHSTGTTDDLVYLPATSVSAGVYYSVFLYGSVAGGMVDPTLGPMGMVLVDDHSKPASGMARIRPVNLAWTTATVAGGAGLAIFDGDDKLFDLDYGEAGMAMEIPAGTQIWGVDYESDPTAEVTFTFDVADGDTANLLFFPGDVLSGDPAVAVLYVHHTTSTAPEEDDTYFDENGAIQVIPVNADD